LLLVGSAVKYPASTHPWYSRPSTAAGSQDLGSAFAESAASGRVLAVTGQF
jgi:hypothetical protein